SSALTSPPEGEVAERSEAGGGWRSPEPLTFHPPPAGDGVSGDLPLKGGGQERSARLSSLGVEAQTLIFCRGFAPESDPWFGGIRFNAAKGEMLTVRVPGLR